MLLIIIFINVSLIQIIPLSTYVHNLPSSTHVTNNPPILSSLATILPYLSLFSPIRSLLSPEFHPKLTSALLFDSSLFKKKKVSEMNETELCEIITSVRCTFIFSPIKILRLLLYQLR